MAYETGTASDNLDLLYKIYTFLTTNAELVSNSQQWEVKRYREMPDASGEYELLICGPGLAGSDEIYAGIRTVSNEPNDTYNLQILGMLGYSANSTFATQPGTFSTSYAPSLLGANFSMTYHIVANGRRFVVVVKVSDVWESMYAGLLIPYMPPSRLPYPMFIAGSDNSANADSRWSYTGSGHTHGIVYPVNYSARMYDSQWHNIRNDGTSNGVWPRSQNSYVISHLIRDNDDGTYTLFPLIVHMSSPVGRIYGEIEGCYYVSGFGLAAGDIVEIDSTNYLIVGNAFRTGITDYWALALE